jgi:quercetin dioxygenase-like cupin family protein
MENKIIYRKSLVSTGNIDSVSGSEFWSLEGKNVQFTWFDVPANTCFPNHKHPSEQITYVIDGELFFKSENSVYKLSKGDCILVPENIEHEVWTEGSPAKAVDAWAPVNTLYTANKTFLNK